MVGSGSQPRDQGSQALVSGPAVFEACMRDPSVSFLWFHGPNFVEGGEREGGETPSILRLNPPLFN